MLNRICQGDNLDILQRLVADDVKFDLICTDPPYNVGKDFGNDTDRLEISHYLDNIGKRIELIKLATTQTASVIWFASHLYVHQMHAMFEQAGFIYQRMLIWHYRNGLSRQTNSPVTEYEPFLWFTRSEEYTYNADDVRVPYRSERVKTPVYKTNKDGIKVAWTPNPRGAKRGDVWEYPTLAGKLYAAERTKHPSQKPESLMTDIIKAFTPKKNGVYCGKVLDPYAGSGTTLVCCDRLNRSGANIQWLGIELEKQWIDVANNRLSDCADIL